jgi:hypothetical protein
MNNIVQLGCLFSKCRRLFVDFSFVIVSIFYCVSRFLFCVKNIFKLKFATLVLANFLITCFVTKILPEEEKKLPTQLLGIWNVFSVKNLQIFFFLINLLKAKNFIKDCHKDVVVNGNQDKKHQILNPFVL